LAGCTRDSILTLARNELPGVTVEERPIKLSELKDCGEAFCCGTGASITPVGQVVAKTAAADSYEKSYKLTGADGRAGPITNKLYKMLYDIQWGTDKKLEKKYKGWILVVDPLKLEPAK